MSNRMRGWMALALMLAGGQALAEGGCPAGYAPFIDNTGRQSCVVDYNLPQPEGGGDYSVRDTYGAVAVSAEKDAFWASERYYSRNGAEQKALEKCAKTGARDCKVVAWFSNTFFAVAKGDDGFYAEMAPSRREAKKKTLEACERNTTSCKAMETFKSRPEYRF